MNYRWMIATSCSLFVALSSVNPCFAQVAVAKTQRPELDRKVEFIVETGRFAIPGVSLVIMRGNKVLLAKGYGLADREKGIAPTGQTIYPIASLSKQFTAAGIMKLVEEGRVRLDEPVTTYLPDYRAKQTKALRIRHLLQQTSGIPEWGELPELQDIDTGDPSRFTLTRMTEVLGNQLQLYQPGDWWSYSNSNYTLLAAVIERVSGMTYEQYLNKTLFIPLKLRSTGDCKPDELPPTGSQYAIGYEPSGKSFEARNLTAIEARAHTGEGGLCSNAVDLAMWTRALVDGKAVSKASFREMITPATVHAGFIAPYGFGLSIVPLVDQPAVWHMGVLAGYSSVLVYFPKQDIIIAALANGRPARLQTVVKKIARAVMGLKEPELYDLPISAEKLNRVIGNYDDGLLKFRIYADAGQLYIHVPEFVGNPRRRLQYQGGEIFATPEPGMIRLWFEPTTGSVGRVVWEWGELRSYGRRIQ